MSKSVPTSITLPILGNLRPGQIVVSDTWREIVAAQHVIYAWQGAHILSTVYDPPWLSLDFGAGGSSYHSVGQGTAGGLELNQHSGIYRFQRRMYNTTAAAHGFNISLDVYAQNLNVRATLVRFDTVDGDTTSVTNFTTLITSHGADSEWDVDSLEFTEAQASRSGSYTDDTDLAFFAVYLEAQVPASGDGQIHEIALRETPLTAAASLPRGAS